MAEAFKCDRCGKFYTECGDDAVYKVAQVIEDSIGAGWPRYKTLDLCPYCRESLAKWYEAVKEE